MEFLAPNFAFLDENFRTISFSDSIPATQNLGGGVILLVPTPPRRHCGLALSCQRTLNVFAQRVKRRGKVVNRSRKEIVSSTLQRGRRRQPLVKFIPAARKRLSPKKSSQKPLTRQRSATSLARPTTSSSTSSSRPAVVVAAAVAASAVSGGTSVAAGTAVKRPRGRPRKHPIAGKTHLHTENIR